MSFVIRKKQIEGNGTRPISSSLVTSEIRKNERSKWRVIDDKGWGGPSLVFISSFYFPYLLKDELPMRIFSNRLRPKTFINFE